MFSAILTATLPSASPTLEFAGDGSWSCTSGITFIDGSPLCAIGTPNIFTLVSSGTYTLTRSSVAVPEPPIAWLFLAALACLGAVAAIRRLPRRHRAIAVS